MEKQNVLQKTKKGNRPVLVCAVLFALAALVFISGINKPFLSPFTTRISFDNPVAVGYSDTHKAVIDKQGHRMLILNAEDELIALADTTKSGSALDVITYAYTHGDTVYCIGYTQIDRGTFIGSEKLVSYTLKGKEKETLYTRTYDAAQKIMTPAFSAITMNGDDVYITVVDGREVSVLKSCGIPDAVETVYRSESPEAVNCGVYSGRLDELYILCRSTNCYADSFDGNGFRAITFRQCLTALVSASGTTPTEEWLDLAEEDHSFPFIVAGSDGNDRYYVFVDSAAGDYRVFSVSEDIYGDPNGTATYSTGFFIRNLLYWLSVALLGAALVALLVWLAVKKATKQMARILLIAIVLMFIAGFYSYNNYKDKEKQIGDAMIAECSQMSILITECAGQPYREISDYGVEEFCTDITCAPIVDYHQRVLRDLATVDGNGSGLIIEMYFLDREENLYTYVDSRDLNLSGTVVIFDEELLARLAEAGQFQNIVYYGETETRLTNYSYIYDEAGEVSAIMSVSCLVGELKHVLWQNTLNLFLTLSCILIAAYIGVKTLIVFSADFKRMRFRSDDRQDLRRTDMCGLYCFLESIIFSADSVVLVYVARNMCEGFPEAQQAVLIALPLTAFAAGSLVGKFVYMFFIKHFGERNTALITAAGLLGFSVLLAFSVRQNSIWLLSLGKLFTGIFLGGFAFNIADQLPLSTKDEQARREAFNSSTQSFLSASIISILLGGYLSTLLSYQAIYLMGAFAALLLFFLSMMIFQKNGKLTSGTPAEDGDSIDLRAAWSVFTRKPMILYVLLYTVPTMLINSYCTYLYPLYTAGAGISAMLLSKIAVFSKTLTFLLNEPVRAVSKRLNEKVMLIVPKLILCAGFICFFLSPNVYWAIFIYFAFNIVVRMGGLSERMVIIDISNRYGANTKAVQSNHQCVYSFLNIFRSPVASVFVSFGMNLACTAVGVIAGAMFGLYGFATFLRDKIAKPREA